MRSELHIQSIDPRMTMDKKVGGVGPTQGALNRDQRRPSDHVALDDVKKISRYPKALFE